MVVGVVLNLKIVYWLIPMLLQIPHIMQQKLVNVKNVQVMDLKKIRMEYTV